MGLVKRNSGSFVVFISSIAGEEIVYEWFAHYGASKAGLNGLMRTAAIDSGNIINEEVFKLKSRIQKEETR